MIRITADITAHRCAKCFRVAASMLAAGVFAACAVPREQAYVTDVDSHLWENPAVIIIPNTDTTGLYDLHIFLRSDKRFTADTLPLRISVLTPDSVFFEERFLFAASRRQVPSALSLESDRPYRRHVRFAHPGDYRITISPDRTIEGVKAVGIHLVKNE